MLRISWQTLRARRGSLAGAFVAIFLAVMLAYGTGLLMAGALSAPGPGRLAAADAVVRADPTVTVGRGAIPRRSTSSPPPACRRPRSTASRRCRGVAAAVGDVSFPVGRRSGGAPRARGAGVDRVQGHGWASAALTPYRLTAGRAPSGPRDVVLDARLACPRRRAPSTSRRRAARGPTGSPASRAAPRTRTAARPPCSSPPAPPTASPARPGRINAVGIIAKPGASLAGLERPGLEVLDRAHAADADAGDPRASDRASLIAIFGTMGGIAGMVALFVVAGTFALVIAQRRRETAVLRALGATPRQVRRLIATEALFVSLAASALGLLAGRPLANALVDLLAGHGDVPAGFAPGHSWIPLVAALGMGVGIAQLAVVAAARRAGKVRPAEALREVAVEHGRPGVVRTLSGVIALGGGAAIAVLFQGERRRRSRSSPASRWRRASRCSGAGCSGCPAAALALPAARARRARAPGEHRAGRQPLAQRRAGDADPADRHARRHAGRAGAPARATTRRP